MGISFSLLLMAFFLKQAVYPEIIWTNDFYGFIELGKNIFRDFNFLVRWQLDNLMTYPPLFSIIIYLLTLLTKDPLASIRYLNAFSASFCLIPLFLVTRKLLNNFSAVLVTILMIYFFGLSRPCYDPCSDYFFTFLAMVIFWLLWGVMTKEKQGPSAYVFLGVVISLAYLTKFQGAIFFLLAAVLIFCFFKRKALPVKVILKKILFLMLGFLPLVLIYHACVYNNVRQEKIYAAHIVGFFDGITGMEERERTTYMLNSAGSEFNQLDECRAYTVASFCSRWPGLVLARYKRGFQKTSKIMTKIVFPFSFSGDENFYILIQYVLFALVLAALIFCPARFPLIYILCFFSIVLSFPFYMIMERYLIPFVPFYFMLWLAGVNGIYCLVRHNDKIKHLRHIVRMLIVVAAVALAYTYFFKFYDIVRHPIPAEECRYPEYLKAAEWLRGDFRGRPGRPKIMSRKTSFAYLADAYFISLPYENSWDRIIKFALLKNVDYVILDGKTLSCLRADQWKYLTEVSPGAEHIRLVYLDAADHNKILIFKIY